MDSEASNKERSELLSAMDKDRQNSLHFAVQSGNDSELVKFLLRMKVPALPTRSKGETPLHIACKAGDKETVLLLIERGCNPNEADH